MKSFVLSLVLLIPCQKADEGDAYSFRVGTKWTYVSKRKDEKVGTMTVKVTKIENGRTHLSVETRDAAGRLSNSGELVRWIEDGGLCSANVVDGRSIDPQMEYKFGSKEGDGWVNALGDTTATHEGKVEVKVPAGTYKEAILIKVTSDADGRVVFKFWLVPKVGWIRMTADPMTLELEKFEQP